MKQMPGIAPKMPDSNTSGKAADNDLLAALSGRAADRSREVAFRTRRVVSTSAGVLGEQKERRKSNRATAVAAVMVVFFLMGPLIWYGYEMRQSSDHPSNAYGLLGLLLFFLGGAVLACALLAGWLRRRG